MTERAAEDRLFEEFLERYCDSGDATLPAEWPQALKDRCLFFVKMLSSEEPTKVASERRSIVSDLEKTGASASLSLAGEDAAPPSAPVRSGERYVVEREIGRGGMGMVLVAYDRDFRRRVAMKVMKGRGMSAARLSRFLEEAQATAQLEHPNIAPVYDLGTQAGGAPFFTMKWIRGRDLKHIIDAREPEHTLIRLVQILQQAAMGIHFANSRGVIHRDLKPQNVMVGSYGEVIVVDWGLAKILGRSAEPGAVPPMAPVAESENAPPSTARGDEGRLTLEGSIQGSPAYMSPEQARGDVAEIDARTDVFGLGAILYEILTGVPPYKDPSPQVAKGKARRGEISSPSERTPERSIPPELDLICRRSLAPRKEDRFQSARELHDALQRYVEGIHDAERRAAEASRLCGEADALREALREAEARETRLRDDAASLRQKLSDHDPEEAKHGLWELESRRGAAKEETASALNRVAAAYQAVLSIDPESGRARKALAQTFYEKLLAAENRGDGEAASLYEGLVRQHHDGAYTIELDGEGLLKLTSNPSGATVQLSRYEERGPLLVESPPATLGPTPLDRRLPRGSYLAVLRKPGFIDTRYPFVIGRGGPASCRVRLLEEGSIPDGFVYVPGGETIVGGHDREVSALERQIVTIGDLVVGRFPVTLGEYCEYLSEELTGDQPALHDHIPAFGQEAYVAQGANGRFAPIERLPPNVPAHALSLEAVDAYCAWLTRRNGRRARLLAEIEWERCARGSDGRIYPWGNGFDWALCKGGLSRPGKPFPEGVGVFPRDVSPFGVRDLAGCVRELVLGESAKGYRPCRGGSWLNSFPFVFRSDLRTTRGEHTRSTDVGFRVCYDVLARG